MNNEPNDYMNTETVKEDGGNKKIVFVLGGAVLLGAIVLTIALMSVILKDNNSAVESTLAYELTSAQELANTDSQQDSEFDFNFDNTNTADIVSGDNVQTEISGQAQSEQSGANTITAKPTKNAAVEYYEKLSPNGENILSDHFENKYIEQISASYGVDSDLLVAIYSEPDTGNNFVLEFNGDRDSSGNIIKSPDTLAKVYQIDKNGGVKIATGKESGNVGVSYAEGLFCVSMIKTVVMEQYPDYFTGLKK